MAAVQGAISAAERSMRSVFVGNIPYEATEEQLKDIFAEVGPVVSFRLVYDRETGKPKGYGFCEYKDQEMALSAMRNLNGYELNGRALRVDNAASEKSKEELKNIQASLGGPPVESPYGPPVEPEKAPEEISKAVASLPPEQMFELMKQMKTCIQNNPNEARNLLLQNPQLAYALLQAAVVMRIVDPQVAMSLLHRQNPTGPIPAESEPPKSINMPYQQQNNETMGNDWYMAANNFNVSTGIATSVPFQTTPAVATDMMPPNIMASSGIHTVPSMPPTQVNPAMVNPRMPNMPMPQVRPSLLGDKPPVMNEPPIRHPGPLAPPIPPPAPPQFSERGPHPHRDMPGPGPFVPGSHPHMKGDMPGPIPKSGPLMEPPFMDPRSGGDRDMRQPPPGSDRDLRMPPPPPMMIDKDMRQVMGDQDLRHMPGPPPPPQQPPADNRPFDPRFRGMQGAAENRPGPPPFDRSRPYDPRTVYDGRQTRPDDPRNGQAAPRSNVPPPAPPPVVPQTSPSTATSSPRPPQPSLVAAAAAIAPHDQEKAALIMQVLQLSDQQIAMLAPEQRQSIMILKEQITRSRH